MLKGDIMIFISNGWSPNMRVEDHCLLDFHKIDEATFNRYCKVARSCMNKANLAMILDIEYNPEHVQLRPGDALIAIHIKGGKLAPSDTELPENVYLEYYCYNVYSANTHVIIEKEQILMEE